MKYYATAEQMKRIDHESINNIGIPSLVLMESAALSVFEEINKRFSKDTKFLIVCGSGNNSGDGLALARILFINGYKVDCYLNRSCGSNEFNIQLEIIKNLGIKCYDDVLITYILQNYNVIVDSIFGIGLNSDIRDDYNFIFNAINISNKFVISIDIPSGINASNGKVMGNAIKADLTVTFGVNKFGLIAHPGNTYAGEVVVKNIGFPDYIIIRNAETFYSLEDSDIKLPLRLNHMHKGNFGTSLIIAGNKDMFGALYFASAACYKTGCGKIYNYTHINNKQSINTLLPEAITYTYQDKIDPVIYELLNNSNVCMIGSGLGLDDISKELFNIVINNYKHPIVIDADGINLIDLDNINLIANKNVIITPHIGEFKNLCRRLNIDYTDNLETALTFYNRYNINMILKDYISLIPEEGNKFCLNITGDVTLAKAGSGDLLAGTITSLISQGTNIKDAIKYGSYLHGKLGRNTGKILGKRTVNASDILNNWRLYE